MSREIILVLGPQGSGKSTQAKLLADYLDYQFLSTGQMIREASQKHNDLAENLNRYQLLGKLVPDEIVEKMLFDRITESDSLGFVIDGFPRDKKQLEDFLNFIEDNGYDFNHAFYLDVSLRECLNRLRLRREIENRPDETDGAIKTRLNVYFSNTEPLLSKYDRLGVLEKVNGEKSIQEIQDNIQDIINNYLEKSRFYGNN